MLTTTNRPARSGLGKSSSILLACLVIASCSLKGIDEWVDIVDHSAAHIVLDIAGFQLERNQARLYQQRDGWAEVGEWRNTGGKPVKVRIFAHSNFERVFMLSAVTPLETVVRSLSGDSYVALGSTGRIVTRNGFYDYQFYQLSGVPCAIVQAFWGDRSFRGIDVVRGADAADTIVGNHMLQAYICSARKSLLDADDLAEFMFSIDLRGAYWPEDRFDRVE